MLGVTKRVRMWKEVEPFYPDQTRGLPKSSESRGTEAVLNALILSTRDAHAGALTEDARQALANMWPLQFKAGELKGGWAWLNFHYEPWESNDSAYYGATPARRDRSAGAATRRRPTFRISSSSCARPAARQRTRNGSSIV
jgi:hypothetical protein